MATFNLQQTVNHEEAAALIGANGTSVSYIISGEPGVGKSSILKTLQQKYGDKYDYIYVDVPNKDIPNIALSMPDHERQVTKDFVHEMWIGTDKNKPKVIMLDEVFKGGDYVKLMMNRLLLERTVGDYVLPEGSIVFGTTNLQTDGVGDRSNGHTNSRVVHLTMRKPSMEEWTAWAIKNEVDGSLLAFVQSRTDLFQSYTDFSATDAKDSESVLHYIYHPQTNNKTYVAPRTLKLASDQMKKVEQVGWNLTSIALAGTFGKKAALDFEAYAKLGMELPPMELVLSQPKTTPVPKDNMAKLVFVYRSLNCIKTDADATACMEYMKRFNNPELIITWVRSGVLRDGLSELITSNKLVTHYCMKDDEGSFLWRGE